jgi:hypothetical protein
MQTADVIKTLREERRELPGKARATRANETRSCSQGPRLHEELKEIQSQARCTRTRSTTAANMSESEETESHMEETEVNMYKYSAPI